MQLSSRKLLQPPTWRLMPSLSAQPAVTSSKKVIAQQPPQQPMTELTLSTGFLFLV